MSISKAIARAWSDPSYKAKLLRNPKAALAELGVEVPEGVTINVVENTDDEAHVVLPVPPADAGSSSIDDLEKAAGGITFYHPYSICCP